MSAKTIFWVGVALYEIAVITKFYILPALRRREERKISRMTASERKRYFTYINY